MDKVQRSKEFALWIPIFMERFSFGGNIEWNKQYRYPDGKWEPLSPKPYKEPTRQDFWDHFEQRPIKHGTWLSGSIGLCGRFEGDVVRWMGIDVDEAAGVDAVLNNLLPVFDKYGIDYVYEHGGLNNDKCHIWFLVNTSLSVLTRFINQLFTEAGLDHRDRKYGFELFPTQRPNNKLRLPGGLHLKTSMIHPITYGELTSSDPVFILKTFCQLKVLSDEWIKANTTTSPIVKKDKQFKKIKRGSFFFRGEGLKLPANDLPPVIEACASNCLAINRVLTEAIEKGLIEERGGQSHTAGLFLWNLAIYNDIRLSTGKNNEWRGEQWATKFFNKYRFRDFGSHNWLHSKALAKENPERIFPKCSTWDREFGACEGCRFKNRPDFYSPKKFFYGKKIKRTMTREVKLVSAHEIRTTTFDQVKKRILQLLEAAARENSVSEESSGIG